jgi:hypothetical protein
LGTRDLLFLMPGEWWAPVWEPVLVSCAFIAGAILILARSRKTLAASHRTQAGAVENR